MKKNKNTYHERYFIFKRDCVDLEIDDVYFSVYERFNTKGDLIKYLAKNYSNEYGRFNTDYDLTGNDTQNVSKGLRYVEGLNGYEWVSESKIERKRHIVSLECFRKDYDDSSYAGESLVINPYDLKKELIMKISLGKVMPKPERFRNGPVAGTGRNRKTKHCRPIKHTSWFFTELSFYEEFGGRKPYENCMDWDSYGRGYRKNKSWKQRKIKKQWMKHLK